MRGADAAVKIAVDNVLGTQPLPGILSTLPADPSPSRTAALVVAVILVVGTALLTKLQVLALDNPTTAPTTAPSTQPNGETITQTLVGPVIPH